MKSLATPEQINLIESWDNIKDYLLEDIQQVEVSVQCVGECESDIKQKKQQELQIIKDKVTTTINIDLKISPEKICVLINDYLDIRESIYAVRTAIVFKTHYETPEITGGQGMYGGANILNGNL